jgi:hypothetical protein
MSEESLNYLNNSSLKKSSDFHFKNIKERDMRILQNRKSQLQVLFK